MSFFEAIRLLPPLLILLPQYWIGLVWFGLDWIGLDLGLGLGLFYSFPPSPFYSFLLRSYYLCFAWSTSGDDGLTER